MTNVFSHLYIAFQNLQGNALDRIMHIDLCRCDMMLRCCFESHCCRSDSSGEHFIGASEIISIIAVIVSAMSLIISVFVQVKQVKYQNKVIAETYRQNHITTMFDIYTLGKMYTSNISDYSKEIENLKAEINKGIRAKEFSKIYREDCYNELRDAIAYFDFIQKMVEKGCLTNKDCYSIVTFPINLYESLRPVAEYAGKNDIHDFDGFIQFCNDYLVYMQNSIKEEKQ